jgi:hypothetical protein
MSSDNLNDYFFTKTNKIHDEIKTHCKTTNNLTTTTSVINKKQFIEKE